MDKRKLHVVMLGPALDVRGGVSSVERLILAHAPSDVEFYHIATMCDGSKGRKLVVFIRAVACYLWHLLNRRVDLVHIHFASRASAWRKSIFAAIARLFGRPYILHAHGGKFLEFFSRQPRWIQLWITRTLRNSCLLIALSEGWKQAYMSISGVPEEKIAVLPNPIKLPSRLPDRRGRDPVTMLFLGRMDSNKGALRVVQALRALPAEVLERVRLVMAGDGEVERVRLEVSNLGLEKQVTVWDWVNAEQRDMLLAGADIFVLPSLHEGLPMGVLEAMSWGLPVVASPVGGIPEVVQDGFNGLLVPPTDIAAIGDALRRLIEDETLRLQMAANARASVEGFHILRYREQLRRIYENALGGGGQ